MAERDHVRAHTNPEVVNRLDDEARARVEASAAEGTISPRIAALRREWDIERYLEANASAFAGAGVLLAAVHHRRWLLVPGVVLPFLLLHALHGWCPPVPLFRKAGIRTRQEIDRELYALKAARGDFDAIGSGAQAWTAAAPR